MLPKQFLLLFCLILTGESAAQDYPTKQFLFLDDWSYDLVDYWVNSGKMTFPHILNQPYALTEIESKLPQGSKWTKLLGKYYRRVYNQPGFAKVVLYARDNLTFVSKKLPPGPGITTTPVRNVYFFKNQNQNHYNLAPQVNLLLPHVALVNRTMINSEYRDDPLYAGDNSESLFGRVNDAYLNLTFGPVNFFAGRMQRNWGTPGVPGLILSDNAYTFDHLQFAYTIPRLKFSMLFSRLEDLPALFDEVPDSLIHSRKFISAHRLDFSFSKKLQFAATEIVMYGGPDRDFEFAYLNPLNLFYLVQRNQQLQANGLWALELFYKPHAQVNLFVQFLIDDFIINNGPEKNDRTKSPDRLGIHFRISEADLFVRGLQTGLEYTRIGNRTYQARRTWENFHYRGKSLGFPISSTEQIAVFARYFGFYPLQISAHASYSRTGDVHLTDLYPLETREPFPVPVVERALALRFSGSYFLKYWVRLSARFQYECFDNYNHLESPNRSVVKATIGVHIDLSAKIPVIK